MSQLLDRLNFLSRRTAGTFADGHGVTTREDRSWEDSYRGRWQHDRVVRSTHGVNCTGSCSWKIYVKGGIVTWESQQTDYPATRPELPDHEPRGCSRGASYSWYLYSASRLRYPLVRSHLLRLWREARRTLAPVAAWESLVGDPQKRASWVSRRGLGGFLRSDWAEINEIVAAANAHTIRTHGPDRIVGFSPIPAMSMVSYAAGTRYLSLLGGVCLSFYDWYCDLPPSSPQTWGEQTDVPESADWYNSDFLLLWGSNVPQTRTPDAHFYTEARYRGARSVVVSPDYSEAAKFADLWLHPRQGTDAALALAMGHVVLREFHVDRKCTPFRDYCRQNSDMPMLVRLEKRGEWHIPDRLLRASDFADRLGEDNNPKWKTVAIDANTDEAVAPLGAIGYRWGEEGRWTIDERDGRGRETRLRLSLVDPDVRDSVVEVGFPYFGGREHHCYSGPVVDDVLRRRVPVRVLELAEGPVPVATVHDLLIANYGVDQGLGGPHAASGFDQPMPYTPAWAEAVTGVPAASTIAVAREFAQTAERTGGRAMAILGAGINHWYHMDMTYRAIVNLLIMCGCVGRSGGGWCHYVGQEKVRPQTGWLPLAFALDWARPPRQMNATSFWYAHTDQWRYESVGVADLLSPTAPAGDWEGTLIDFNVRAERMGWLPSAPQLERNPLEVAADARKAGQDVKDNVVQGLCTGKLRLACEDPDNPANWPRNLFVWRSNLLGASAKGHEYFLKHLIGSEHGARARDLDETGSAKPRDVTWRETAPEGKLDLLVTIDFRMSTTCVYSDIVLPTATWYEKNDLSTTDLHPFIHPLGRAVDPLWESRSDWDIFKGFADAFSQIAPEVLGKEEDIVLAPILHDTPLEIAQPLEVLDWKRGETDPVPGRTMPQIAVVERDYPNIGRRFAALGPLMDCLGNGGKGLTWETNEEVDELGLLNGRVDRPGVTEGRPRIDTDIDAAETILMLAPETNGRVAGRAWEALERHTGRDHAHLAAARADEKIRFRDLVARPRKIITSPIWSGLESEEVCYNAGYTNLQERIPWRTLTGRQQLYQDHLWMRAFGEGFCVYRAPLDTRSVAHLSQADGDNDRTLLLSFITPHQKWGIHSTFFDNLLMLTLNRGGPVLWISETDAEKAGIEDNDWVEAHNANGALAARAVVSQRIMAGTTFMYHAQEKTVNTPGSAITGRRGGIHNSVTRTLVKPTHMIGGYAHQAYGFNYIGTVGSNRDDFVLVRRMNKIDWLDGPRAQGETSR